MAFINDDYCLYFAMMTDAARAQGQTCISMASCEDATNCLVEHIIED